MHAPRKGTPMHDDLRAVWLLLLIGAGIALGKLLASDERITLRLAAGRIILGSATSLVAGMLLLQTVDGQQGSDRSRAIPSVPPARVASLRLHAAHARDAQRRVGAVHEL